MNKILAIALIAKGFENINAILEIAEATGNKEIALEKLLGIYEQPELPATSVIASRGNCVLVGFNHFQNSPVSYTYEKHKEVCLYPSRKLTDLEIREIKFGLPVIISPLADDKESMEYVLESEDTVTLCRQYSPLRKSSDNSFYSEIQKKETNSSSCSIEDWKRGAGVTVVNLTKGKK